MPLLVEDYTWTQTDSMVYINVPLKGAKAGNVDILATDEYLKVHFPPFLFEAFLFEPVNDDRSSAKIGNGVALTPMEITSALTTCECVSDNKEKKKAIRERALLKHQEKVAVESKAKAAKRQEEKKYALRKMMQWLKKQAEARRAVNADLEELKDLKEEEKNPDWLKEKGE
uniref:Dynein axonemal assembly factor 4 n=1 Tax=Myripristis murdjan TaxID=586833 RepID=A0A668AMR8_9TELE